MANSFVITAEVIYTPITGFRTVVMVVNSQFLCIPPKLAGSSEKSYSATVIRESVIQFIITN